MSNCIAHTTRTIHPIHHSNHSLSLALAPTSQNHQARSINTKQHPSDSHCPAPAQLLDLTPPRYIHKPNHPTTLSSLLQHNQSTLKKKDMQRQKHSTLLHQSPTQASHLARLINIKRKEQQCWTLDIKISSTIWFSAPLQAQQQLNQQPSSSSSSSSPRYPFKILPLQSPDVGLFKSFFPAV